MKTIILFGQRDDRVELKRRFFYSPCSTSRHPPRRRAPPRVSSRLLNRPSPPPPGSKELSGKPKKSPPSPAQLCFETADLRYEHQAFKLDRQIGMFNVCPSSFPSAMRNSERGSSRLLFSLTRRGITSMPRAFFFPSRNSCS